MLPAPIPENEEQRLLSLYKLGLLDTPPEKRFDLITKTAIKIFNVPISTLTLVDSKREWFKSCQGLPVHEGDRAVSFCGHALLEDEILVIPDTLKDDRFADNPMVIGEPFLRFYAGVPLISADGQRVGVFCLKDTKPREFSVTDREVLKGLAQWAEVEINSRNLSLALSSERKILAELRLKNNDLLELETTREASKRAMQNVLEDLTSAKTALQIEQARSEATIASLGEGLVALDVNRNVTIFNNTAEKMLGLASSEVLGHKITDLRLEDEEGNLIPFSLRPTTLAFENEEITKVTYYYVKKNKTRFPIAITATPIKHEGKVIGLVELIRDVTKEQEIDKAKSEFVSLASHQLRTPLGIIKWYLEALETQEYIKNSPEEVKSYVDQIAKSNERLLNLVRDLLSVSRIDQNRVKDEPRLVNVIEEVKVVMTEMNFIANSKNIKLVLNIDKPNIPELGLDPLRLHEVLENMLSNALAYTPSGGTVSVCVDFNDQNVLLQFKDTGMGISPADQKMLFTKFFRASQAVVTEPEGSGLGLYVVKSYVESWGGNVTVESTVGVGSTFTISLPISQKKNILRKPDQL